MSKPILMRVCENDSDLGTMDVVWCPFWGTKPDTNKCEDKGFAYFINLTKKHIDEHYT